MNSKAPNKQETSKDNPESKTERFSLGNSHGFSFVRRRDFGIVGKGTSTFYIVKGKHLQILVGIDESIIEGFNEGFLRI